MSPIYVRPEREQAEHDRLIRFLQARYSQDFEALANPGDERLAPVKVAAVTHFPDLVLNDDKRLAGVVEIETMASVNNLETMAKWVPFSRARVPFHLYVPVQGYEAAMRLAEAHQVKAAEIWTYRPAVEGFDLVRMFVDPAMQQESRPARPAAARANAAKPAAAASASRTADTAARRPAAKAATRSATAAKPAKAARPATKPAKPAKPAKTSRTGTKATAPASKGKARPAAKAKPAAARRPAPVKRAATPTKARAARPAPKGGKKGAGARKGR